METVDIKEDVHVRDKYGVRRRAFVKGTTVNKNIYDTILGTDTVLKDEKSVEEPKQESKEEPKAVEEVAVETKTLPAEPVKKEVEKSAKKKTN